jgi:hypothetical protein
VAGDYVVGLQMRLNAPVQRSMMNFATIDKVLLSKILGILIKSVSHHKLSTKTKRNETIELFELQSYYLIYYATLYILPAKMLDSKRTKTPARSSMMSRRTPKQKIPLKYDYRRRHSPKGLNIIRSSPMSEKL